MDGRRDEPDKRTVLALKKKMKQRQKTIKSVWRTETASAHGQRGDELPRAIALELCSEPHRW